MEKKIPWYLSIWFILILYATTWWLLWIPAIIINIIRIVKCEKRKIPVIILSIVGAFGLLVGYITISDSNKEKQFNAYIENGEYDKAIEYVDSLSKSSVSTYYKYAQVYAAQGDYDKSVDVLLEYANSHDLLDLSKGFFEKLDSYAKEASEEKQKLVNQLNIDYKSAIEKQEQEKAAKEKAEKEAKEKEKQEKVAKEKAEKEAKEAEKAEEAAKKMAEEDKKKYGITRDEFEKVLFSYSDPGDTTEDDIDQYYEDWKNDPQHWGWKKDSLGNWNPPVTQEDIAAQAVRFSYKDVMRNPSQYEGVYIAKKFYFDSKVTGTSGTYRAFTLNEYGLPDYNSHFVIIDNRTDDLKILDGDIGIVYGTIIGVNDTDYTQTNAFTDKTSQLEVPEINMLYFELIEE